MSAADPLLQPFRLKHLTFKNRVMSTAHAPNYVEDGLPRQRYQLYHEEKAKGGLALTMFGGASSIAPDSPASFGQIDLGHDRVVPVLQEFSERIHAHGCALMVQMTHAGRRTRWDAGDWLPTVSASPLRELQHRSFPKELEVEDIRRIHKAFAAAALRAKQGGIDGVEIACSTHLPHQFWSPVMNRRTDSYGGSLANRIRFTLEMFAAIREAVGSDYVRRHPHVGRRDAGGRPGTRGEPGDRRPPRRERHDRLSQRHRRGCQHGSRHLQADPDHGPAHGALCRARTRLQAGDRPAGVPRHPHHRPQHGAARHRRGLRRHGRHDPRAHRRPASDGQGDARRGGSDPALRRVPATASTGSMSAARPCASTTRPPGARRPCRTRSPAATDRGGASW